MDTIRSVISGNNAQNGEEPVSGQRGDTSKGEPYDAGNKNASSDAAGDNTATNTNTNANPSGNTDEPRDDSEVKDSSAHAGDSTGSQNDTRDPSNPDTHPDTETARSNVNDRGDGPNATDLSGPGPRPVAKLAAEHGGDAGATGGGDGGGEGGGEGDEEEDDDDGPQKKSHGEGTGEQYVKSTGLKADGGDFDASRPGAGKEADRLMEEKGMHNPTETSSQPDPDAGGEDPLANRKGLGGKIKEKVTRSKMGH